MISQILTSRSFSTMTSLFVGAHKGNLKPGFYFANSTYPIASYFISSSSTENNLQLVLNNSKVIFCIHCSALRSINVLRLRHIKMIQSSPLIIFLLITFNVRCNTIKVHSRFSTYLTLCGRSPILVTLLYCMKKI